jgi:two-component sensor histidine kinase
MFEIKPTQSAWLQNRSTPIKDHGFLVMDGEGNLLNKHPDSTNSALSGAMEVAVRTWTQERPRYEFPVRHLDKEFTALLTPYALNGQTLYTGVVLDRSATDAYVQPERLVLRVLFILLGALGLTLGMLWWQRRASIRRIRAQERYSRSQELQLAKAIGEREVLNREVHHRVKNNLQVVSSLLNLQASGLDNGPLRDEFLRGKQRIDSIALVHHKLYGLKDLRRVDLQAFITALTDALATVHQPKSHTVICDVRTNGIRIDQDTAIGLGIILCELVANAYQHAFPYATGGHIDIEIMNVEGDLHRMVMKDNGVGLDPQASSSGSQLGLEIVEAMADQLDGSFHTRSSEGSTFEVLFRVKQLPASTQAILPDTDSL